MKTRRILKKALSVALCAVLLGGTAVMLPAVSSEVSVIADAAETYGDFQYEISDNEVTITKYTGNGGNVTIPDKIEGKPVTSIGYEAFSGCTGLTSVKIGNSVTSIGDWAFSYCTRLTSITIPDSVTSIGYGVFEGCTELKSVTIPDSVTSFGGTFAGCTGLTSITIPDSVTSISESTFSDCTGLTSIIIPDSVTSIGFYAFSGCTGLTSIIIPDSVTSIEWSAFEGCTGLTSVAIGNSVTSIDESAFSRCTGLTSIDVSENNSEYSSIDGVLFSKDKTELRMYPKGKKGSYSIPDSVTSIGGSAFSGCTGLTSITIPDSVTSIDGYAFEGCTGLTSITIPDSVTSIGSRAFYSCVGLTSITIPDSVTRIGSYAFYRCTGLTSIIIPDSVTSIGWYAFSDCTGLTSITIPDSVIYIDEGAFGYYFDNDSCSECKDDGFTIYGKKGSAAEEYANDNGFIFVEIDFSLKNISSISSDSINLNETITLTAKAQYGTKPYTYAFMYKAPGATSWKVIGTKFGTSNKETLKPTKAGTYEILISVKDSTGNTESKKFSLDVKDNRLVNRSSVSGTDVPCGTKITITGAAEGGTEPYYYTYQYQKPDKTSWITLGEKYGTAESANFTPKAAGTYKARVLVKDSKGTVKSSVFTVNVTGELLVNKSTISAAEVTTGTKVTITSATTGGTVPFYYTYEYKAPSASKWTTIGKRNSANTTASFTPTSTGTYEARVYIKDAGGFVTVKNFKVTVK